MKLVILITLILILLVSGCLEIVKKSPADTNISAEECTRLEGHLSISENCASGEQLVGKINSSTFCCVLEEPPPEENLPPENVDLCSSNADCNDNNSCTVDSCSGTPKECKNNAVTSCSNNDGCCPANCSPQSDSDCTTLDECTTNSDCNDNDACSVDICGGSPKTCTNSELFSCVDNDGCCPDGCETFGDSDCQTTQECQTDLDCDDGNIGTTDSCNQITNTCSNTLKTCSQRNGFICSSNQSCANSLLTVSDTTNCCPVQCTGSNQCEIDNDCNDNNSCTVDNCSGNPKTCSNTNITSCTNGDGCCPAGCVFDNDNDCAAPVGDLSATGNLTLTGLSILSELEEANCWDRGTNVSGVYFTLNNSFEEEISAVEFDLYIDNQIVEHSDYTYSNLLRRANTGSTWEYGIPTGEHIVYLDLQKTVGGHTVKIVMDPVQEIIETNEQNNTIETSFPPLLMDLSVEGFEYKLGNLFVIINRGIVTDECPGFSSDVYVDGVKDESVNFFGFNFDPLEGELWGPQITSGEYEVRVVLDVENKIEESNESNNDITQTVTIP